MQPLTVPDFNEWLMLRHGYCATLRGEVSFAPPAYADGGGPVRSCRFMRADYLPFAASVALLLAPCSGTPAALDLGTDGGQDAGQDWGPLGIGRAPSWLGRGANWARDNASWHPPP